MSNGAPVCPISRDQPVPDMARRRIRSTIPHAFDLSSALQAVNIARTIVQQLAFDRTINNTFVQQTSTRNERPKKPRWQEVISQRVKQNYTYFAIQDGAVDTSSFVTTERIERMVWYDRVYRVYLVFQYGTPYAKNSARDNGTAFDEITAV